MATNLSRPVHIERIKPQAKQKMHKQGTVANLYIDVSPKGKKVWRWQSVIGGKTVKHKLGEWPAMDIPTAKRLAGDLNDRRVAGEPLVEPTEAAALDTLRSFAEDFLEAKRDSGKGIKTIAEYDRLLRGHVYPICGDKLLNDLTRDDMDAVIDPLRKRGVGVLSNRVLAILRPIVRKAVARDLLIKDVTSHIDKFHEAKGKKNDRALSIDELAKLYAAADDMDDPAQCDALRLLILTACRRNEVVAAATADWDGKTWTIPAADYADDEANHVGTAKNDKPHPLTLGPRGKAILDARNKGEHFFVEGKIHRYKWPDFLANARKALKANGHEIPAWDLRAIRRGVRTAITSDEMRAAGHNFTEEAGERLLNHSLPALNATYNKNDYRGLIADVLLSWENLLTSCLEK